MLRLINNHSLIKTCHQHLNSYRSKMKGIVLGVYTESSENGNNVVSYTKSFQDLNNKYDGQLEMILKATGPFYSPMQRLLWTPLLGKEESKFDCISIVSLGAKECKNKPSECRNERHETIRCAIALGIKSLAAASRFDDVFLDSCEDPQSVGEAGCLILHKFENLKSQTTPTPNLHLYEYDGIDSSTVAEYNKGILIAECQNFARILAETPANRMTPTIFTSRVAEMFKDLAKIEIRDKEWIKSMKMGSFLSVTEGSDEPPKFLEIHYDGNPDSTEHVSFVGKGITFDSGGISLKPPANMDKMRADMGGAASVVGTLLAVSKLKLKINVKAFIPLTENMPSGKATKPGDVVFAMTGKSIQVDNTDCEGRLVLADGLCYAQQFNPKLLIDVATLTGAGAICLSTAAACGISNNDEYWDLLYKAGFETGDRVWRLPLYGCFTKTITSAHLADVNNAAGGGKGGVCTAAAFLQEFVKPDVQWMHIDMSNVKDNDGDVPYLGKGMSGRPTRTFVQFLEYLSEKQ